MPTHQGDGIQKRGRGFVVPSSSALGDGMTFLQSVGGQGGPDRRQLVLPVATTILAGRDGQSSRPPASSCAGHRLCRYTVRVNSIDTPSDSHNGSLCEVVLSVASYLRQCAGRTNCRLAGQPHPYRGLSDIIEPIRSNCSETQSSTRSYSMRVGNSTGTKRPLLGPGPKSITFMLSSPRAISLRSVSGSSKWSKL